MSNYRLASIDGRRRRHGGAVVTPADPLGAGNTALIGASGLNVTPLAFYDVRKNLTAPSGTFSSLLDVTGAGTYGPSFGFAGTAPTWDGTVIKTNGNGILLTSAVVTGLDLSTQLTVAIIADITSTTAGNQACTIGAAAAGTPAWKVPLVNTGALFRSNTSGNATGAASTAATGTGNIRLAIYSVNALGTGKISVEVPNTAQAVSGNGTALAAGNQLISIGGTTAATGPNAVRFRALIAWTGGYTVGQAATLMAYAQTFHGAVAA